MIRYFITAFIISLVQVSFGQTDYLEQGNQQLNSGDYAAAEIIFREAIRNDSSNLVYHDQLAFALMQQKKYSEAQSVLDKVLLKDSLNVGALWYSGNNNFLVKNGDLRVAVKYFEKTLTLLNGTVDDLKNTIGKVNSFCRII